MPHDLTPNTRVLLICIATLAVLTLGAWRGAFSWHVPTFFAVGVVCPAFGIKPGNVLGSGNGDKEP